MFRVIVTGPSSFRDYRLLRDALDAALANRLPHVVILSGCGWGTDALATSYALARRLELVPVRLGDDPHPMDAAHRRTRRLVEPADAAVIVVENSDWILRDLIGRCRVKGIPVRLVGMPPPEKLREEDLPPPLFRRVLPD